MNVKGAGVEKIALQNGLTMIEVVVVMAVIAILAAIALPALAAGGHQSRRVLCLNNIKQLTLAEIMYCEENGHSVPDTTPAGSVGGWVVNLSNYIQGATNLILCPTTTQPSQPIDVYDGNAFTPWCRKDYDGNDAPYFGSYEMNGWFYTKRSDAAQGDGDGVNEILPSGQTGNPNGYYLTAAQVKRPGSTPVFSDGIWVDSWPLENDAPCHDLRGTVGQDSPNQGSLGREIARACVARHNCDPFAQNTWTTPNQQPVVGAVNVGLFDGHAELSSLPHLWSYYWHNNWSPGKVVIGNPY